MTPKLFQIFRGGLHRSMNGDETTFSEDDLAKMAAAFSPSIRPAPLVLGHPQDDMPQFGNVFSLMCKGGKLYAQALVGDTLLDLVKKGRYKYVSASFYPPFHNSNPTPGAYYLKHVGFLGALPPAVKGMPGLEFAEKAGSLCFGEASDASFSIGDQQAAGTTSGYDPERMVLHSLALDYQRVCPALSYAEAVSYAEAITF